MGRRFNTDGYCDPKLHYMVNLSGRLNEIRYMVDAGKYFAVNKARQYGKTTILTALADFLEQDYEVLSLDFQMFSYSDFESEQNFVAALSGELLECAEHISEEVKEKLKLYVGSERREATLSVLFRTLSQMCKEPERKVVMIIDEVDTATNNQVFLDFLSQLRAYYLRRSRTPVFQSVILAGVYDVRNIPRKLRPEEEHKENSPWNIAADFLVDMDFSTEDIKGMLQEYETDHHTGMDLD